MHVGFFTDTFAPNQNGVVVSIETFAAELQALGCRTTIFAPDTRHPLAGRRRRLHARGAAEVRWVRSVPWMIDRSYRFALPAIRQLAQVADDSAVDLVHTHTPFALGYAGLHVGRRLRLPVVHTYHTYFAEYAHYLRAGAVFGRRAAPPVSRWFCNLHNLVLAPSSDVRALLESYGVRSPIDVVMSGVKLPAPADPDDGHCVRSRAGMAADAPLLLYVGRVAREKNLDLLLRTLVRLVARKPETRLALVGDGPDGPRLKALARRLGVEAQLHWAGWIPHDALRPWYAAADVFVFASLTETQGLAVLEAMAHALPVVAANGPGLRDTLVDGDNGLVVEPIPAAFAAGVAKILDDRRTAARLAGSAQRTATHLSATNQARRLLNHYEALGAATPGRQGGRRGIRDLAASAWETAAAWR